MSNSRMSYCLDVGAGHFPRGNVAIDIRHTHMGKVIEHYVIGDACNLPFRDNCFSKLESHGAVNYFVDDEKFLNEVRRVVRPKGLVIISAYSYYDFFTYLLKSIKGGDSGILRIILNTLRGRYRWYTITTLKRKFHQQGLEVTKTYANVSLYWRPTRTPHNLALVAIKR